MGGQVDPGVLRGPGDGVTGREDVRIAEAPAA
jgi:hypothetical protein